MKNVPEKIWLLACDSDYCTDWTGDETDEKNCPECDFKTLSDNGEILWSEDDATGTGTEYVRADLYGQAKAELTALKANLRTINIVLSEAREDSAIKLERLKKKIEQLVER